MDDFKKTLNDCLKKFDFNQIEVGPLKSPLTIDFYQKWLQNNNHGSMSYLKDHYPLKKDPRLLHQNLQSVISISQSYFPPPQPQTDKNPARVALYAQNLDYHYWLKEKLNLVIGEIQKLYPDEVFLPFVDSGPILERNWAYENGLGWFGKNTCIIHPKHGSLFFIAEIMTSVKITSVEKLEPLPDFCGKCQKCIEICPTQALTSPRQMKADRCISYLTIEAKGPAPVELRPLMGDWFFGCDLCQTICPWNEKVFRRKEIPRNHDTAISSTLPLDSDERADLVRYFRWILASSHNQIQKKTSGTPLARAGAKGLKRNALIVIANRGLSELKDEVLQLGIPDLEELKEWTLSQI